MSKEAYYFSHDANARHDIKIRAMILQYGMKGYGCFWTIIENLREQSNFKLPKKEYTFLSLSKDTDTSVDDIKSYVKDCIEKYELFEEDEGFFYSNSLIRRMDLKAEISKKRSAAARKRWNDEPDENNTDANAVQKQCTSNAIKEKESKVKENKYNPAFVSLVTLLITKIEKNDSSHFNGKDRKMIIEKWYDSIRLLIEKDGRSPEEVEAVIKWSQSSDFWKSNILSTKKLREKFPQLLLQMKSEKKNKPGFKDSEDKKYCPVCGCSLFNGVCPEGCEINQEVV